MRPNSNNICCPVAFSSRWLAPGSIGLLLPSIQGSSHRSRNPDSFLTLPTNRIKYMWGAFRVLFKLYFGFCLYLPLVVYLDYPRLFVPFDCALILKETRKNCCRRVGELAKHAMHIDSKLTTVNENQCCLRIDTAVKLDDLT